LLTNLGYRTPHEKVLRTVDTPTPSFLTITRTAESSWAVVPYAKWFHRRDVVIVHVVRSPLNVIASLVETQPLGPDRWFGEGVGRWLEMTHRYETPVDRAAAFWIEWNRMIEPHADFRWPVGRMMFSDLVGFQTRMGDDPEPRKAMKAFQMTPALAVTPKRPTGLPDYRMPNIDEIDRKLRPLLVNMLARYGIGWAQPHPPAEGGVYPIEPVVG
jgi:hypothetical protein